MRNRVNNATHMMTTSTVSCSAAGHTKRIIKKYTKKKSYYGTIIIRNQTGRRGYIIQPYIPRVCVTGIIWLWGVCENAAAVCEKRTNRK